MRVLLTGLIAATIAFLGACGRADDDARTSPPPAPDAPTQPATMDSPPHPLSDVPEGTLLVQTTAAIPVPIFGIDGRVDVKEYKTGYLHSTSPDSGAAIIVEQQGREHSGTALGVLAGDSYTRVAESPPFVAWRPWSPDGTRIAYMLPSEDDEGMRHVYVAGSDGRDARRLTQEPSDYVLTGWSHDGRVVAQSTEGLFLIGESMEALPRPHSEWADVTVSPDGRKAAIQPYTAGEDSTGTYELWLLEFESQRLTQLSRPATVRLAAEGLYVSSALPSMPAARAYALARKGPPPVYWSPDSSRIAYHDAQPGEGDNWDWELRLADLANGSDIVISDDDVSRVEWSPDGRYLAYVRHEGRLLTMMGPGGAVDTEMRVTGIFTWTPGGGLVLGDSDRVLIVDPQTLGTTEVTQSGGEPVEGGSALVPAVWSPSGRYVAFSPSHRFPTHIQKLYVVDVETASATVLLDEPGAFRPVGWLQ